MLHPLKCCINALASEKSILKAIKCGIKMSFSKILHGIQNGNAGNLDTASSYIFKFLASGQDPHLFYASGQGTSIDAGESGWVA